MHYKSFVTFLRAENESYVIMYLKYLNLHQYHAGFRFLFTYEMKLREPYTSRRDRRDTVDRLFKPRSAGINLVPRVLSYPSLQVGERIWERGWAEMGMLTVIKARLSGEELYYLAKWGAIRTHLTLPQPSLLISLVAH